MGTESPSNAKKVCLESLDRLSNLPPKVIDEILKIIPISQAIRTSVLSKKWRYNWMSLSDLVFDPGSIPHTLKYRLHMLRFVNKVLMLHNATVSRFEICYFVDSECPDIDQWVLLLERKCVKQFILMLESCREVRYNVPSLLFSCQYLNMLKLKDCVLKFPSDAKGFKLLTVLELQNVSFTDETIASIVSTSPLLTDLSLESCIGFTRLSISPPSLTKFFFKGCGIKTFERKSVQQFILVLGGYGVPSSLYSCQYLNYLKLHDCELKFPSDAKGFKFLRVLELHTVTFTDDTFASLVSASPLLNDLSLDSCTGFTRLSISAPSLTKIVFNGCCGDITFENTLKLMDAKLEVTKPTAVTRNNGEHRLEDVLAGLINIQKLYVSQYFMEILADRIVPERLPFTYDSLLSIELSMNFKDPKVVSAALCFFRSFTFLEEMKIKSSHNKNLRDSDTWKQRQHLEEFIFPKLKTVKLDKFKGGQCELGFVKFILKMAVVLETLKVEWKCGIGGLDYFDGSYNRRLDALGTMNQFPRASPTAQVIFK